MSKQVNRIIVGISGASGIIYGVRMLEVLRKAGAERFYGEGGRPLV